MIMLIDDCNDYFDCDDNDDDKNNYCTVENNWILSDNSFTSASPIYIPGPIPTLTISAPERISCSTISPVTTLPAYKWTKNNVINK